MPVGIERGIFKIEVGHARKRTTHLKVSHSFNTQWLRANLGASLIRIGHSASPWVSKEYGNLWSSPTILAASTRTNSCLSGSPTLAGMTWLYPGPRGWPSRSLWTAKMLTGLWFRIWAAPSRISWPSKLAATKWCPSTTLMSSTVKMVSGRQPQRGQMVIIRRSMPLITEKRWGFESVLKTEIQALSLTRQWCLW